VLYERFSYISLRIDDEKKKHNVSPELKNVEINATCFQEDANTA
jgi:hypothetical protein